MTSQTLQKVDHSALKTNQLIIISLSVLAFILNQPILAAFVALVMGIGSALKVPGFGFVYKSLLKPRGWMKPDVLDDNPEPHRFAQFLGFLFMTAGSLALFLGSSVLGWSLVWIVVALAALNAFGGFCVGCAVYYWLARINAPGFSKQPPTGTFPGMKPKSGAERMSSDILLRFLLAIGIIVVGLGVYWLVNQRLLARARNNVFSLFNTFPNKPVLVYFTTPDLRAVQNRPAPRD